ncbi:hypothetical protein GG344DRAFT_83339 [Lentinula edodes]|nr:hypothetical protein GG344DRAFT_83339 [Lentinula edodes]
MVVTFETCSLIWQPKIEDLEKTLEHEIEQFLLHAAKWSIQWFNKPKFHILVHLPAHIRRFGPAILFAMEGFESYNAIIRAKSVHSNRLAPSRDIALAFAKQNRIRHMLSGGLFLDRGHIELDNHADKNFHDVRLPQGAHITQVQLYFRQHSFKKGDCFSVGNSITDVMSWSSDSIGRYLGCSKTKKSLTGSCTLDPTASEQCWQNTQSGRRVPDSPLFTNSEKLNGKYRRVKEVLIANGDRCMPSSYVACSDPILRPFSHHGISIAHVTEALQLQHRDSLSAVADSVLIEPMIVGSIPSAHGMPRLVASRKFFLALQCTANVQHDCDHNHCQVEQVGTVMQEREKTNGAKGVVVHRGNLQDLVLNTAQMWDANKGVETHVLEESAAREWDTLNKLPNTTGRPAARSPQTSTVLALPSPLNPPVPGQPQFNPHPYPTLNSPSNSPLNPCPHSQLIPHLPYRPLTLNSALNPQVLQVSLSHSHHHSLASVQSRNFDDFPSSLNMLRPYSPHPHSGYPLPTMPDISLYHQQSSLDASSLLNLLHCRQGGAAVLPMRSLSPGNTPDLRTPHQVTSPILPGFSQPHAFQTCNSSNLYSRSSNDSFPSGWPLWGQNFGPIHPSTTNHGPSSSSLHPTTPSTSDLSPMIQDNTQFDSWDGIHRQ